MIGLFCTYPDPDDNIEVKCLGVFDSLDKVPEKFKKHKMLNGNKGYFELKYPSSDFVLDSIEYDRQWFYDTREVELNKLFYPIEGC